jgi:hypothetical protein
MYEIILERGYAVSERFRNTDVTVGIAVSILVAVRTSSLTK